MEYVGYISTEGGPLLLMDAVLASSWKGAEGEGYDRACRSFDTDRGLEGVELPIGAGKGVLWEMEGAGTADVFKKDDDHYVVVRSWPKDPNDTNAPRSMAQELQRESVEIGQLSVESGILVLLWAAEDGKCIQSLTVPPSGRPAGGLTIEDSVLVLRLSKKSFRCFHDRVETKAGVGRRLHLLAEG